MTTRELVAFAKRKPALATLVCVGLLSLDALSGRGILSGVGEYARAEDVVSQGEKIDRILKLQIAASLRQLKQEACRSNGNKDVIQGTIERYQQDYFSLAGERYPLPKCET